MRTSGTALTWGSEHSPPLRGGVDATSIKFREATADGADGVVSSASMPDLAVLTTPSAPSLCSAQPPLLCQEGNASDKEAFEGFDHALRRFLRQIVAGVERPAGHVGRGLAPDGKGVVVVKHSRVASAPPHDQHGCGDFAPGLVIRLAVPEIDSRGRAIVLARTVNRLW